MSHYLDIKTCITNKDALIKALVRKGFKPEHIEYHKDGDNLYGYQGDKRKQKANVIIRREHVGTASNDLGFVQKEDGTFEAIISQFDSTKYNQKWLNEVGTFHNVENAKEAFARNGWDYTESVNEEGQIQLVGTSY